VPKFYVTTYILNNEEYFKCVLREEEKKTYKLQLKFYNDQDWNQILDY
jgi:spore coat polysaccharide biosynthesis protein SpsF (cytidylyltransferase family)